MCVLKWHEYTVEDCKGHTRDYTVCNIMIANALNNTIIQFKRTIIYVFFQQINLLKSLTINNNKIQHLTLTTVNIIIID